MDNVKIMSQDIYSLMSDRPFLSLRRSKSVSDIRRSKKSACDELHHIVRQGNIKSDHKDAPSAKETLVKIEHHQGGLTLRHIRRSDIPRVQRLMTPSVLDNLADDDVDKVNDFSCIVTWVEEKLDRRRWFDPQVELDFNISYEVLDDDFDLGDDDSVFKIPPYLAIALEDRFIGIIGCWFGDPDSSRSAELVYWLGEEYWGKGIISKVIESYVNWLWDTFPRMRRVYGKVYAWNPASIRVLQKLGFQYEGTMRKAVYQKNPERYGDIEIWNVLREDWQEKRQGK